METYQSGIIIALLAISVVTFFAPFVFYGLRRLAVKPPYEVYKQSTVSQMFALTACMLCSVWCFQYALGYYAVVSAEGGALTLTWGEVIFNSMIQALEAVGVEDNYADYVLSGKQMLAAVLGENNGWETVFGLYISVLYFVVPVAGGALIFEMLASVFPRVRLWMAHLTFWEEKFYFSQLNGASLALAKSIRMTHGRFMKKPVIIFANVAGEDEDSGMLQEAKLLGAICMKNDLTHIRKNKLGRRKFFLIDEEESGNLKLLTDLANTGNAVYLKHAELYLFTNDDAYIHVERSVRDKLRTDLQFSEEELPVFIPVLNYRNLISNLLVDVPLYEPLIGKKPDSQGNQSLTVTIFGTGHIGMEMFLSAYWLGQILHCDLKINVISQESEEAFWSKIDYVNPEIRHTTLEGDPILRINHKGDMAKVYCQVCYLQCDVKSSEFVSCLLEPEKNVLDTDYFLVCLGSDEDNIAVANTVRKYIGQYHLKSKETVKTVIAYVVVDSELSKILNRKKFYSFVNGKVDVYMQAIGSMQDVYSVKNVFMTDQEPFAEKVYAAYLAIQSREERSRIHKKRMNNDYEHWANLARGMHLKYKMYSMGMLQDSMFDYPDNPEAYKENMEMVYAAYKRVVSGGILFESAEHEAKHLELLHQMAWLEHRRWNAFTRVKGFRGTTDYDAYAAPGVMGSYKQMDLKLHPCLVECDQKGIRASISSKGIIDEKTLFQSQDQENFDLLDELSYDLYTKKYNDYDFKQYDYPISAF